MDKRVVEQQLIAQGWLIDRMAVKAIHETIHLHDLGPGTNQNTILVGFHVSHLQGEAIGMGKIVLILPGHIGSTGQGDAMVEGTGKALIVLVQKAEALIVKLLKDRSGPIDRAIVNHNQLKVSKRLRKDAGDGRMQIGETVVNGQDNGNAWRGRRHLISLIRRG